MADQNFENSVLLSTGKILPVSNKISNDSPEGNDSDAVVVDRVRNVWGSSSGAGSDFLDTYRKQRNVEMLRLEEMDKKWREDMENKLFHSQRMYRIKKESDKTLKRKMKRDRRKRKNDLKNSNKYEQMETTGSDDVHTFIDESKNRHPSTEPRYASGQDSSTNLPDLTDINKDSYDHPEIPQKTNNLIIIEDPLNDF